MKLPSNIRDWPAEHYELWQERAAIMELEGGLTRIRAEREAEQDIRKIAKEQH